MKLLKFSVFCFLFHITNLHAQHSVNVSNIDVLGFDSELYVSMYQKVGENAYTYSELYIDDDDDGFYKIAIDKEDKHQYTLEDIKKEHEKILFVADIAPTPFSSWQQQDWLLQYEESTADEPHLVKFKDHGFSTFEELEITDTAATNNSNPSQWEIMDGYWLLNIIVDFGDGKQIVLLTEDDNIYFACIPLKDGMKVLSDEAEVLDVIPVSKDTYFVDFYNSMKGFEISNIYAIEKNASQKYSVYDYLKKDLLNASYDTILYNEYYLIGKTTTSYTLYNTLLEKLKTPLIKKAHLKDNYLEVLAENDAYYYDNLGNVFREMPESLPMVLCGTVNSIQYELIRDEHSKSQHGIKITEGGMASTFDEIKEFIFTDINKRHEISFLDNSSKQYWDENDQFTGAVSGFPNYIKVQKGKKYGIRSYSYTMQDDMFTADTINNPNSYKKQIIHKIPDLITTVEELPIKYDAITISKHGLILFYKDNKVGIFPKQKKPTYELLEKVTKSFYKIIKNGKSGWLDITTMEEFFFDD
ncbi:hypothetical protein [uncultured Kordia sp.]|uniref:hypothetical protein n=1 Tax=uncultured Kordia sp. TaxID=507699 RepID=UPI00262E286E|nr:hypothetical protein [uncultured Kordia sp.]